ncbi:conserved hypothetical protein [Theileria orientalis strain Shintoku]|uniref:Uncharacterized protein n=1 Tax=Theileria orientalis strain Shintoku TaxID=869250 RepID=J4CCS4_THEOR|nr:conserved hypothetical protein [Theileria orientalis strain Shintoku]BAM39897.1 conserved hypothetical protein [Theileria orientalis strain Shintoku]|eukprot:XP_009690198.1 conserved hypothetical protein [Theileria orientalis strain Shintoku]
MISQNSNSIKHMRIIVILLLARIVLVSSSPPGPSKNTSETKNHAKTITYIPNKRLRLSSLTESETNTVVEHTSIISEKNSITSIEISRDEGEKVLEVFKRFDFLTSIFYTEDEKLYRVRQEEFIEQIRIKILEVIEKVSQENKSALLYYLGRTCSNTVEQYRNEMAQAITFIKLKMYEQLVTMCTVLENILEDVKIFQIINKQCENVSISGTAGSTTPKNMEEIESEDSMEVAFNKIKLRMDKKSTNNEMMEEETGSMSYILPNSPETECYIVERIIEREGSEDSYLEVESDTRINTTETNMEGRKKGRNREIYDTNEEYEVERESKRQTWETGIVGSYMDSNSMALVRSINRVPEWDGSSMRSRRSDSESKTGFESSCSRGTWRMTGEKAATTREGSTRVPGKVMRVIKSERMSTSGTPVPVPGPGPINMRPTMPELASTSSGRVMSEAGSTRLIMPELASTSSGRVMSEAGSTRLIMPELASTSSGRVMSEAGSTRLIMPEQGNMRVTLWDTNGIMLSNRRGNSEERSFGTLEQNEEVTEDNIEIEEEEEGSYIMNEEMLKERERSNTVDRQRKIMENEGYKDDKEVSTKNYGEGRGVWNKERGTREMKQFISHIREGYMPKFEESESKLAEAFTASLTIIQETGMVEYLMREYKMKQAKAKFVTEMMFEVTKEREKYEEDEHAADYLGLKDLYEYGKLKSGKRRGYRRSEREGVKVKEAAIQMATKTFPKVEIDYEKMEDAGVLGEEKEEEVGDLEDVLLKREIRVLVYPNDYEVFLNFHNRKMSSFYNRYITLAVKVMERHYFGRSRERIRIRYVRSTDPMADLAEGKGHMTGIYFNLEDKYPSEALFGRKTETAKVPMLSYSSFILVHSKYGVSDLRGWQKMMRSPPDEKRIIITNFARHRLFEEAQGYKVVNIVLTNQWDSALQKMLEFNPTSGVFWGIDSTQYSYGDYNIIEFPYRVIQGAHFRKDSRYIYECMYKMKEKGVTLVLLNTENEGLE